MRIAVLASLAVVFAAACSSGGSSGPAPEATSTTDPPSLATSTTSITSGSPSALPAALTGVEILRRSDEAMEGVGYVVTEERMWARDPRGPEELTFVRETHGLELRDLSSSSTGDGCVARTGRANRFANRSLGATALYGTGMGASAPADVEILRDELYEGEQTWVIRFRYDSPSVEGPYPVEYTEWIAQDDYRLLRQEIEQFDPFGFVGQTVVRFVEYRDIPSACPRDATSTLDELRPVTSPRLELPRR